MIRTYDPLCHTACFHVLEDLTIYCTCDFPSPPLPFPRVCPIFQVSNVTGENLGLLKSFVNLLTARMQPNCDKPAEFQIDETYYVPVSTYLPDHVHIGPQARLVVTPLCVHSSLAFNLPLPLISLTPLSRVWVLWYLGPACRVRSVLETSSS